MTASMSTFRSAALALAFSAFFAGCAKGTSAEDHQQMIEAALSVKDWEAAATKADAALADPAVTKDPAKAWRFESLRLTALAEGGKGELVLASLTRLSGTHKAQMTPSLYRSMADKLKEGGDAQGAIAVLDAAIKAHPDDPSFQATIETLKTSADPAEIEKLKALGYL